MDRIRKSSGDGGERKKRRKEKGASRRPRKVSAELVAAQVANANALDSLVVEAVSVVG